jgi:hypothetical protein
MPGEVKLHPNGQLPRRLLVKGKTELVSLLRWWLSASGAPTIGIVGAFGNSPCLLIDVGGYRIALNVDTKRAAVETFVRQSAHNPEREWRVVANTKGIINKVLPEPLPGWYAYLMHPWNAEGVISRP